MGDEFSYRRMSESPSAKIYAEGLINRKLYKEIESVPERKMTKKDSEKLEKELSEKFECDIIIDYPTKFSKTVGLKVKTGDGLKPLTELSLLVNSLQKAEEERRRILILAEEKVRKEKGDKIRKALSSS